MSVARPAHTAASPGPSLRAPHAKGRQTRAALVDAALALAAHRGLEGLSIGAVAELTGMSKSGVFAHFGSREELQISVLREYHARFEAEVFRPSMAEPRGLPRLRALFDRWLQRVSQEIDAGCIYIGGAVEFDDRPGPVRDALVGMVQTWHRTLEHAIALAIDQGHLTAGIDAVQLRFEIQALVLSLHHDARFLRTPGSVDRARDAFARLIHTYLPDPDPDPDRATDGRSARPRLASAGRA